MEIWNHTRRREIIADTHDKHWTEGRVSRYFRLNFSRVPIQIRIHIIRRDDGLSLRVLIISASRYIAGVRAKCSAPCSGSAHVSSFRSSLNLRDDFSIPSVLCLIARASRVSVNILPRTPERLSDSSCARRRELFSALNKRTSSTRDLARYSELSTCWGFSPANLFREARFPFFIKDFWGIKDSLIDILRILKVSRDKDKVFGVRREIQVIDLCSYCPLPSAPLRRILRGTPLQHPTQGYRLYTWMTATSTGKERFVKAKMGPRLKINSFHHPAICAQMPRDLL